MANDQLDKRKVVWEKSFIVLKTRDPKFCRAEILHRVFKIEIITCKSVKLLHANLYVADMQRSSNVLITHSFYETGKITTKSIPYEINSIQGTALRTGQFLRNQRCSVTCTLDSLP